MHIGAKLGLIAGGAPIEITFGEANFDTTLLTTHSYTLDIGDADIRRTVLLCIGTNGNPNIITSVTINGDNATLVYNGGSSFYALAVPTGTTAAVVITTNVGARISCASYSLLNLKSLTPTEVLDTTNTSNSISQNITVPSGGCSVSVALLFGGSGTSGSWTNITERYDVYQSSMGNHTGASTITEGATTITASASASGRNYMTTISLR